MRRAEGSILAGLGLAFLAVGVRLAVAQTISTHVVPASGKAPAAPFQILTVGEPVVSGAAGPFLGLGFVHALSPFLVLSDVSAELSPNTLNLKSQGKFITVHFEITGVKTTDQINPATLAITRINGDAIAPISAEPKPIYLEDSNLDGILELMVKFDRQALIAILPVAEQVKITLAGILTDGSPFFVTGFIRTIQPGNIPSKGGGQVVHPAGAKIDVPEDAVPGGANLHIVKLTGIKPGEHESHNGKAKALGKHLVGNPFEFGPEGTTFPAPVTISIPFDSAAVRDVNALTIAYWNPKTEEWEPLPSTVDQAAGVVLAQTDHFSLYQVLGSESAVSATGAEFGLKEIYVFPNPAVGGAKPTIHVEVGIADSVTIQIFNIAGQPVHAGSFNGAPGVVNNRYAYEFLWDGHIPSGVYLYTVKAEKTGHSPVRATGKLAVVR